MMKLPISILCICVVFFLSFRKDDTVDLYRQSLKFYIGNSKVDTIYDLKCPDINIPEKIGRIAIIDIESSEVDLIKQKGILNAVKLMPIELNKNVIEITLVDFVLTEENKERIMKNFGSVTYGFQFDDAKKMYKLIKTIKHPI